MWSSSKKQQGQFSCFFLAVTGLCLSLSKLYLGMQHLSFKPILRHSNNRRDSYGSSNRHKQIKIGSQLNTHHLLLTPSSFDVYSTICKMQYKEVPGLTYCMMLWHQFRWCSSLWERLLLPWQLRCDRNPYCISRGVRDNTEAL